MPLNCVQPTAPELRRVLDLLPANQQLALHGRDAALQRRHRLLVPHDLLTAAGGGVQAGFLESCPALSPWHSASLQPQQPTQACPPTSAAPAR